MAGLMNHDDVRAAPGNGIRGESGNHSPCSFAWVFVRSAEARCTSVGLREDPIAAGPVIGPASPVPGKILPRSGTVDARRDLRTLTALGDVQARPEPVAA